MLLCIVTKYFIWPPAKYWFYVCQKTFSKPKPDDSTTTQQATQSNVSMPSLIIIEQVLMQQQTLLREMKDVMEERVRVMP
jgi:hypothetical protein